MERADKQPEEILPDDLDKALDDMDNKLNLTADEKDLGINFLLLLPQGIADMPGLARRHCPVPFSVLAPCPQAEGGGRVARNVKSQGPGLPGPGPSPAPGTWQNLRRSCCPPAR